MGDAATRQSPVGVAVLDKPAGMTSHDVVNRMRRTLHTRRVGHAGTLDPMATGVLLVMVGEATKLAPYLTAANKCYAATVQLGRATDTLDAEGAVTEEAPLPSWWGDDRAAAEHLEAAVEQERGRTEQAPPAYSAIKVAGRRAHARARAGEDVALEPRAVRAHHIEIVGRSVAAGRFDLRLTVSKGYYVRALARDIGVALGVPAHLCALRRTASGAFEIAEAVPLDEATAASLMALEEAASRALPMVTLTPQGVARARQGGVMQGDDFEQPPPDRPAAWCEPGGRLVAIGGRRDGRPAVLRGFVAPTQR